MSVFLTPDGRPFYGGTYFPDEPRHGMPSFRQVLEGVARAWREQRDELEAAGSRLVATLVEQQRTRWPAAADDPTRELLDEPRSTALDAAFDARNGGWGGAPKFPQPMTDRVPAPPDGRRRPASPRRSRRFTLDKMADGGIHDQLGGGFHRYATDAIWLVPALRADALRQRPARPGLPPRLGVDRRRRATARSRRACSTTCSASSRPADGAFAASQDADTDGVEGADVHLARGRDPRGARRRRRAVLAGVRRHRRRQLGGRARSCRGSGRTPDTPPPSRDGRRVRGAAWRRRGRGSSSAGRPGRSRPATTRRSRPGTGWRSRPSPTRRGSSARDDATRPRRSRGRRGDHRRPPRGGRLARRGRGRTAGPTGQGVLEDYAHLADGLLALYEATFDERWFTTARGADGPRPRAVRRPGGRLLRHRRRPRAARHAAEGPPGQRGPVRERDGDAGAAAAGGVDRRGPLPRRRRTRDADGRRRSSARYPTGFAQWLSAMDLALAPVVEVAIVGDPADPATQALLAETTARLPPEPGRGACSADPGTSRRPAARRPGRHRRPAHRVRLPRLRLPPAGDDARGAARRAGGRDRHAPTAGDRAAHRRPVA